MNKKRIFGLVALILIVAVLATVLVACNKYKWDKVSGGDANAATLSNGGYYVEQGGYAYFINGYDAGTTDENGVTQPVDNSWGKPVKNAIVRVKINADGTYDNASAKVIVPKQIYNEYKEGGFAIFGEWIYYATPNSDKDKNGKASTTHTDFMRTKIDGSVTQLIATINSRSTEYLFTPNRIIYRESSSATTIDYIDFSGMKGDKSSAGAKGVKYGTLASNVENVFWNYDASYTKGQGAVISDYIVYTETLTGDDSYEFCNNLKMVNYNGTVKSLADKFTYLNDEEKENYTAYFKDKVFSFDLLDLVVDSDDMMTLYYKKSNYINGAEKSTGIYMNKITADGFDPAYEIKLANTDATSVYGLGYEKGALIETNSAYYYVKYDVASSAFATEWNGDVYSKKAVGKATTLLAVQGDYVYYYGDDTVYCINLLKETGSCPNETAIASCCVKSDWLSLEIVGSKFIFMDNDDKTYVKVIDFASYTDKAIEGGEFIGIKISSDKTDEI